MRKAAGLTAAPHMIREFEIAGDAPGGGRRGEGRHLRRGRTGRRSPARPRAAASRAWSTAMASTAGRRRTATRGIASRARSARAPTRRASSRARRCRATMARKAHELGPEVVGSTPTRMSCCRGCGAGPPNGVVPVRKRRKSREMRREGTRRRRRRAGARPSCPSHCSTAGPRAGLAVARSRRTSTTSVRAPPRRRHAAKSRAAIGSRGTRRALVARGPVPPARRTGGAVASCSVRSRATTTPEVPRKVGSSSARKSAFNARAREGRLHVVEKVAFAAPKTTAARASCSGGTSASRA